MTLYAHLWPDVPGPFTLHRSDSADFFSPGPDVVLLLEQDLGDGEKRAGWLRLTPEALEDLGSDAERLADFLRRSHLEKIFRPWAFPDEIFFLDNFDPTPRLSRWIHRARFAKRLARDPRARGNLVDDAAFLTSRRLRKLAQDLDDRFEDRRSSWRTRRSS